MQAWKMFLILFCVTFVEVSVFLPILFVWRKKRLVKYIFSAPWPWPAVWIFFSLEQIFLATGPFWMTGFNVRALIEVLVLFLALNAPLQLYALYVLCHCFYFDGPWFVKRTFWREKKISLAKIKLLIKRRPSFRDPRWRLVYYLVATDGETSFLFDILILMGTSPNVRPFGDSADLTYSPDLYNPRLPPFPELRQRFINLKNQYATEAVTDQNHARIKQSAHPDWLGDPGEWPKDI